MPYHSTKEPQGRTWAGLWDALFSESFRRKDEHWVSVSQDKILKPRSPSGFEGLGCRAKVSWFRGLRV